MDDRLNFHTVDQVDAKNFMSRGLYTIDIENTEFKSA